MKQHNICLRFLNALTDKYLLTNNIWMKIFYKNLILRDVLHLTIFILKRYKNNIPFTLAGQIFTIVKNKVRKNLSRLDKL